jgi:hypothetical protein
LVIGQDLQQLLGERDRLRPAQAARAQAALASSGVSSRLAMRRRTVSISSRERRRRFVRLAAVRWLGDEGTPRARAAMQIHVRAAAVREQENAARAAC